MYSSLQAGHSAVFCDGYVRIGYHLYCTGSMSRMGMGMCGDGSSTEDEGSQAYPGADRTNRRGVSLSRYKLGDTDTGRRIDAQYNIEDQCESDFKSRKAEADMTSPVESIQW
jgi:hypothetical protein